MSTDTKPASMSPSGNGEPVALHEVLVRDLRVGADIGVHAHEIGRLQALILHVRLRVHPVHEDHIADTIDYNDVVAHAQALAQQRISLIETFARRLAEACLARPAVIEAEVLVEKPGALPNGIAAARVILSRPLPPLRS